MLTFTKTTPWGQWWTHNHESRGHKPS